MMPIRETKQPHSMPAIHWRPTTVSFSRSLLFGWVLSHLVSHFFNQLALRKVEDKLFRVPRYALEEQSEFFRKLFIPKSQTSSKNVTKDVNEPIFLEEVEKDAFRNLLHLLYPSCV